MSKAKVIWMLISLAGISVIALPVAMAGKLCASAVGCVGSVAAPEIDSASAASALTALSAGLLILRGRRSKK